jgi:hypothetical protein
MCKKTGTLHMVRYNPETTSLLLRQNELAMRSAKALLILNRGDKEPKKREKLGLEVGRP